MSLLWGAAFGSCSRTLTAVQIVLIAVVLRNMMMQTCDGGIVIALDHSIGLWGLWSAHEVFHPRNVHDASKNFLTNCEPLYVS